MISRAELLAINLRVSREEQAASGLDQRPRCVADVEAFGLEGDVRVFVDAALSGRTLEHRALATARGGRGAGRTAHRVLARLQRDGFAAGIEVST